MLFLLCLLVSVSLLLLVASWRHYLKLSKIRKCLEIFPGPPGLPVFGNAFDTGTTTEVLDQLLYHAEKYHHLYKVEFMSSQFFLIGSDPKFLEFALTSPKTVDKSVYYRYMHEWLGTGLLTSGGAKWKQRRRMITSTFHFEILEQFVEVFDTAGDVLVEKLQNEVGEKTNIYPFVTLCTLDIICETAMGTKVNAQIQSNSEYVASVKEMCRILTERSSSIIKMFDSTYKFTGDYYKAKHAVKILHDFTDMVINKRKNEIKQKIFGENSQQTKNKLAFLDMLLKATVDGKPLSHEDIREEVDTFMFEGHDTTASAISFAVYCLANNQNVQRRVVEELTEIFGNDKSRAATYSDLQKMKYLEMVLKETLRLYPSLPIIGRKLEEDVEYGGTMLPKGITLLAISYCVHRNKNVWPEPEKFDPERFTLENSSKRSPFAYIPFSAGQRNCIGQKFAMMEMKALLAKILRNFEIRPQSQEEKLKLAAETVLKSANGISVRLTRRQF